MPIPQIPLPGEPYDNATVIASVWILATFFTQEDRDEAMLTGEYPDDAEPAYINNPEEL